MEADPLFVKDIDEKANQGDQACVAAAICLQAMRSVICNNAVTERAPAYFSGVVTTLQRHLQQPSGRDVDATTSALMLILRRSLTAVSSNAVAARLGHVVEALTVVLKASEKDELVKQALGCLAAVADLTFDGVTEASRPNRKILKPVFSFVGDSRPTVRHRAQLAATSVLKRAQGSDQQTIDFASQYLSKMVSSARVDKKLLDDIPARHAVTLLKAVAPLLPPDNLSSICEALIGLPSKLGQHPVSTEAFEFLAEHLRSDAEGAAEATPAHVNTTTPGSLSVPQNNVALAVTVLQGLLTVPMNLLNVAYAIAFTKALCAAIAILCGPSSRAVAPQVLPQKVAALKQLFAFFSERDPSLLKGVREGCLLIFKAIGKGKDLSFLDRLPEMCQPLLRHDFKSAWSHVLPVIAGMFDAFGSIRTELAPQEIQAYTQSKFAMSRELVSGMVAVRDNAHGGELNVFGKELAQSLGSAMACFGPELMLHVAPLRILEESLTDRKYEQLSRSWLLLVLRENCKRTSLSFFASHFLNLAMALKKRAAEAEAAAPINAKKYVTLLEHVWATLPGFCDEPIDMSAALLAEGGRLAKFLVSNLQGEENIQDCVWQAFSHLANTTLEPPSSLSKALHETNQNCLKTLSSRVMPEMFSAYTKLHASSEGQDASRVSHSRQLAMDTVQKFSRLADPELLTNLFKSIVQKILKVTVGGSDEPISKAVPAADLANALVPQLPPEQLELVLKVFTPMLSGVASGSSEEEKAIATMLQKAAYRAIKLVLQHPATSKGGDVSKLLEFWAGIRDARQTCEASALKARLSAIQALLDIMQIRLAPHFNQPAVKDAYLQCLTAALPEIMFHLRDQSTFVREAARDCLHVAATTAIHQEMQQEVVTLLSAGLASLTPHSKASAVDALSRLLYEHSTLLQASLKDRLIKVVLLLLADMDAQVFRAALKFAKVVVYVVAKDDLVAYLPMILKLFESRHTASAKMLVRNIVERLAKMVPLDTLTEAFPTAHLPLLHYVQRQLARSQRPQSVKNAGQKDEGDEEQNKEDAEMEDAEGSTKKSWDAFREGDERDAPDDVGGGAEVQAPAGKKRARGRAEPATSAVMAHDAMQALLDAWEAESDGEAEGGGAARKGKRKRGEVTASTWIHEDADLPLDFMSADAAHSVLTVRPRQQKRQRGQADAATGAENRADALRRHGLRFAEDGRLVVDDTVDDAGKGGDEEDEQKDKVFSHGTVSKDAKPLSKLAAMRAARARAKAKARMEKRGAHIVKGLDSFKPGKKKASGDAKRKGSQLDPFAYVRLNPKVTKEKFKKRATESFEKVVKGTKKGVLKGRKAKLRDAKQKQFAVEKRRKRGKNKPRPTHQR